MRAVIGLCKAAKAIADAAPIMLAEDIIPEDANTIKSLLEAQGAIVTLS